MGFEIFDRGTFLLSKRKGPTIAEGEFDSACFVFAFDARIPSLVATPPNKIGAQARRREERIDVKCIAMRKNPEFIHYERAHLTCPTAGERGRSADRREGRYRFQGGRSRAGRREWRGREIRSAHACSSPRCSFAR